MRTSSELYEKQQRDSIMITNDARFSVNSNLMNYSMPKNNNEIQQQKKLTTPSPLKENNISREIQRGDSDTRTRQLEAQIEQLTLQNVKLQRTNRLLKVDTDNLIEQRTSPLEKTIQELTVANVRLQRASKLLQQELDEKTHQLNIFKQDQILQMKSIGPEYEFLLQTINLLQRQLSGYPSCDETCCFTMKPIDQSTMVMTLPSPENEDEEEVEAQHICRPVIHSSISQGSYAIELENKITRLEQLIDELDEEKEQIIRQQGYKDADVETLKKEIRIKDEIVSQLEQDFMGLEDQIEHLQKELQDQHTYSTGSRLLTPPPPPPVPIIQRDPKRQSQMLMESKRRSLAIKDTDLLEQMLRGDLEGFDNYHSSEEEEDEEDITLTSRYNSPSTIIIQEDQEINKGTTTTKIAGLLPCAFPCKHASLKINNYSNKKNDPFTLFTGITMILSIASQCGVTDDWTVPITLITLVSSFLWSDQKKNAAKL